MTGRARVALLTTFYHPIVGGAEMAARRLAIFLEQRGHDVFVITKRTDAALQAVAAASCATRAAGLAPDGKKRRRSL